MPAVTRMNWCHRTGAGKKNKIIMRDFDAQTLTSNLKAG